MLKIAYLTKKMDACYWLRCLTPSGVLTSRGHQVQDAIFEQQLWCYDCQNGPHEFHWNQKTAYQCPKCKKQLMTDEDQKNWHDTLDRIIEESDIICFQRPTSKESIELIKHCKERGKKTTQVADDNYLDIPTWNNGYKYYTQRRGIIEETLRVVDALDVTVPYLAERYKNYNSFIEVLPNCHDKEILDSAPPLPNLVVFDGAGKRIDENVFYEAREKNKLVVWGGSPTHEKDLEVVLTSIRRVSRQEKVAFAFVGYAHRALLEIIPPSRLFLFSLVPNSVYLSMMQQIRGDIGIAPVAEHPFNLGKSNLRVLEYCFFRWLPVASNYPTYAGAAPQGLYPNNSDQDWYNALRKAINMDAEEYKERVRSNREYAEEHYDISKQIHRWESFFEKLLAGEKK